jgi:hypothetical protein
MLIKLEDSDQMAIEDEEPSRDTRESTFTATAPSFSDLDLVIKEEPTKMHQDLSEIGSEPPHEII